MAMGKKGGQKRAAKRRAGQRKIARPVRRRTVPEWASCTETMTRANILTNTVYTLSQISLDRFARAKVVAQGYQFYRIKNIKIVLKPLLDTFLAANNYTVPYAYFMIDRTRSLQYITGAYQLKQMGAKARRVDDKVVTFQYRPSVLTNVLQDGPAPQASEFAEYKISPWLPCRDLDTASPNVWNPSTVDHQGAVFIVENMAGVGSQQVPCSIEYVVEFEFKKPAIAVTVAEGVPPALELSDAAFDPPA